MRFFSKMLQKSKNEKLFREKKLSPFSEKFLLKNIAQNGLYLGECFKSKSKIVIKIISERDSYIRVNVREYKFCK